MGEMNFGELEGAVAAESSLYAEVNAAWASGDVERKWPAGESPRDVELRGRQALAGLGLLGQKDGPLHTHVAVVCHGGIDKCGEIQQGNCCINVIDVDVAAAVDAAQPATEVALDSRDHLSGVDADTPS